MKIGNVQFATISKSLVMGLALLLASSAFAATKAHMQLLKDATVNGTTLKAGDYNLQWDGAGPDVQVSIMQGRKLVAKIPAKLVELKTPSRNDAAVVKNNDDGTNTLAAVEFSGKRFGLQLSDSGDGMQSGSAK